MEQDERDGKKVATLTVDDFFDALDKIEQAVYDLDYTHSFKKDVKRCFRSEWNLNLLYKAIELLVQNGMLPEEYFPHPLKGFPRKRWQTVMECHISPDWLLVWKQDVHNLTLLLVDTGTHSYLFSSNALRKK